MIYHITTVAFFSGCGGTTSSPPCWFPPHTVTPSHGEASS
jgi:hypothetical protein